MRNPTVRQIARACGVSPATVSRALSNSPLLTGETRERVQDTARNMGWAPNPLSSIYMAHLRSTKTPSYRATLAYLLPYDDPALYVDYHKRHCKGAHERAASLGYRLEVIWLREFKYDLKKVGNFLKSRGIPGVIINSGELASEAFADFDWDSFAASSWGFSLENPHLHHSGFYYVHGMRTLLAKLQEYGYTRTAMIISEDNNHFSGHAMLPVFNYCEKHPRPGEWFKSYPLRSWHSNRAERKKIQTWLKKYRPEVVIGETISWEAIEEMGWKVPDDIAFVSPNWSGVWPHVGGIDHLPEVIGAHSVELVTDQLTRNERGIPRHPKLILNEGCWRDGVSIPPRNAGP